MSVEASIQRTVDDVRAETRSVPDGYVLVPREPTKAMLDAIDVYEPMMRIDGGYAMDTDPDGMIAVFKKAYSDMILSALRPT